MSTPRFFEDLGLLRHLATVDSSYGECFVSGRLAILVDYQHGVPRSAQIYKMSGATGFKIHMNVSGSG